MDNTSDVNPEDLLREIVEKGISQAVCINDLGIPALFGICNHCFTTTWFLLAILPYVYVWILHLSFPV